MTESLPLYPMAEWGKCVQREGQNREKQHILMGLILRKFYRKKKILSDSGEVFQRNTAAGRFGSRGMDGKSSQRRGAACDFLGGREPLCQNRGSLLRIKFQSLGFIKSRRVFQSKSRNRGERPCGDFQKPPLEKRQTAPYNSLMTQTKGQT